MSGPRTPTERAFITAMRRYKQLGFVRIHELVLHEWMRDTYPEDERPEESPLFGKVLPLRRKTKAKKVRNV